MVSAVPPKDEPTNNSVIMENQPVKVEDIIIEHEEVPGEVKKARGQSDPLSDVRKQMEEAQAAVAEERNKRVAAERERDEATAKFTSTRNELTKSETEKLAAQEASIANKYEAALSEVKNAESALEEAIDTGRPAKEQIALQKKLAEAVYAAKGAENAKRHFETWKENQKNKPQSRQQQASDGYTPAAKQWIDSHPRFNTDTRYRRIAEAAHNEYARTGKEMDTPEYFRYIENTLREEGMEDDGHNNSTAEPAQTQRNRSSATSTAAPVSQNSTSAGANGGGAAGDERRGRRTFKLDGEMKNIALRLYGKGSSFNLSEDEAYKRYAQRQLEIQEKRKNGERI